MDNKYKDVLAELIAAIDRRWDGASDRQRSHAISPRMENAISEARRLLEGDPIIAEGAALRKELLSPK